MAIDQLGLPAEVVSAISRIIETESNPTIQWQQIVSAIGAQFQSQLTPTDFRAMWSTIFSGYASQQLGPPPMWMPDDSAKRESNVAVWMKEHGCKSYLDFHQWSISNRQEFWQQVVSRLGIVFRQAPASTRTEIDRENPVWFPTAKLNIIDSCFQADESATAIISQKPDQPLVRTSYAELRRQANCVSNSLIDAGYHAGDAIGLVMPMTAWSVSIYLGIVQAGLAAVSIADSFAAPEIANRLRISNARAVMTYDLMLRAGKSIPLFERVAEASDVPAIVLPIGDDLAIDLRNKDLGWNRFLIDNDNFDPPSFDPDDCINILFSSGTTGDPKAIPWNHSTPIKCADDGMIHQDIQPGHVVVWPTNLGWMMGPWLIFASLINRGTIGLYEDVPMGEGFGKFVQDSGTNMLGVVPTIVKAWRASQCMESCDWTSINVFSSTGETSQADDMFYLSSLAGMRPVIEYCGGTEIGGGYITSTVVQPNAPATFTTPAAGLDFRILDGDGNLSDEGELFLIPPSVGLSNTLLNRDHHKTYFANTPKQQDGTFLRRHGDHFRRLPGGYFAAGGRVDDTMNLGGIKVSSAEIERVLNQVEGVKESAAVALAPNHGPDLLIVFVVPDSNTGPDAETLHAAMNMAIRTNLNPLFKIHEVHFASALPRTASNKVMRRKLRDQLVPLDK